MKKSEKLFVIGKKPTKLFIFGTALIPLIFSLILSSGIINYFSVGIYGIGVAVIAFLIVSLLFVPTVARWRQHWDISEEYLEHYAVEDYSQQLKYLLSIFSGSEDMFAFKIKLTEIKSIRLYWESMWVISSTPVHLIYFGVTLKDGSAMAFRSLLADSTKEYIAALNYLEDKYNIEIKDEYDLLSTLKDPNIDLAEYIDKIEKQEGRWVAKRD